jgi:uncharacterized protein YndB with AHSA1/START domain
MERLEHRCRDSAVIPAPIEACFAAIADLTTYGRWWTLVSIEPLLGGTELRFGVRFRFWGARPGGSEITWIAQVMDVDEPRRIELAYVSGDLLGRAAWELEPAPEGTRVSFVYRAVRPNSPAAEANFRHFGTRLHSIGMREDAFAGLAHHVAGTRPDLDDESWRAHVLARVAAAIRDLV